MSWITPSSHPVKMVIEFQLEVQVRKAKLSIKMQPPPYNLARYPTVSSIDHLIRRITHHNKQKGSVACPIPPPRFPPVTLAQWAQLLNVLEVWVSAAMFDETKLTVGQDGHPMALELMVDGDMGEGEEVAHTVEVDKRRAIKGKQRDQGNRALDQQTEREDRLQIIVGSFYI